MPDQVRHDRHKLSAFLNWDTVSQGGGLFEELQGVLDSLQNPSVLNSELIDGFFVGKFKEKRLSTVG